LGFHLRYQTNTQGPVDFGVEADVLVLLFRVVCRYLND
jgi:hypothetical protein